MISFYALASGFLTGKYRTAADLTKSVRGGGELKYLNERGLAILAALDSVAPTPGATPGAGGNRLADGAAGHHRADRQRDQRRAARRPARRGERLSSTRRPSRLGSSAVRRPVGARARSGAADAVDDAGARLRRRDRHAVDGHSPRLRPVAAADHPGPRLDARDLRLRAGGPEPGLGHRRRRSPACWPTASAPSACWSSAACSTPRAWPDGAVAHRRWRSPAAPAC